LPHATTRRRNAGEPLSTPSPAPIGIVAGAFPESNGLQDEPCKPISSGKVLSLSLKPEGERFGFNLNSENGSKIPTQGKQNQNLCLFFGFTLAVKFLPYSAADLTVSK
jgi:hypothetical protein